jgi:hypothetical protein
MFHVNHSGVVRHSIEIGPNLATVAVFAVVVVAVVAWWMARTGRNDRWYR